MKRGFVLLAALWVLVGLAALALTLTLGGRESVGAAQNRASLTRARWSAEGCIEVVHSVADDLLADHDRADRRWRQLDVEIERSLVVASMGCNVVLRAVSTTLDVNAADAEQLRRLFLALRVDPLATDSIVDAILDWRDVDDVPRELGAEREWYAAAKRFAPRDGPIADGRELIRIRGLERLSGLDSVLGAEPGRILIGRAPMPVLAAFPGMTEEALIRIAEMRETNALPADLLALAGALSPSVRDSFAAHYAEVKPRLTLDPDAWLVTASARDDDTGPVATVEVRLARSGERTAITRYRRFS